MGLKTRNKDPYNKWRLENLHSLELAGIPHDIVVDNRRFWFVVQEGCDLGQSGWDPSWITDQQASDLLELINGFLGDCRGWDLVYELHAKLGHKRPEGHGAN